MLVVMDENSASEQRAAVEEELEKLGYKSNSIRFNGHYFHKLKNSEQSEEIRQITKLPGVIGAIKEQESSRLAYREAHPEDTVVTVGEARFGDGNLAVIAGPCAVESKEQTLRIAEQVKEAGAQVLRGGAYKPRTSPYSFQGLGERGLEILAEVREETGLPVVTEALDPMSASTVAEYSDMIQIGARNMQNFSLLEAVGGLGKPVLLKRGLSANLTELLAAAEYLMANGCSDVVVCERGIRTFSDHSRNTIDLGLIPVFKQVSHLPIIVDPSHASGIKESVLPLSYAALGVGADGIMVDVHHAPGDAMVDGDQAILPDEFVTMMNQLRATAGSLGKTAGAA
ncbi:MAG: 3-deoxy-7-phosphoheptulonate synthase [Candidatus Marinimicrobia bacterium]|nr:3-deoxy-7-phosphoheptulonate synthase [Candidatus Neomarinimicrobiota bacterium]MCF7828245.1 3-deoxy-7-phosphoheptulonate synthase [Candidatus Neomarinimicrobiota bacterium]MCF7879580.1 3-deoxy-7-phosphoheptulonate synthase [Candidatus Neomarinimicrobiota bacterium]